MSTLLEDVKKMPISQRIQLVEDIWDTIATVPSGSQGTLKLSRTELAEVMLFLLSQFLCGRWNIVLGNLVNGTREMFRQFWPLMTSTTAFQQPA